MESQCALLISAVGWMLASAIESTAVSHCGWLSSNPQMGLLVHESRLADSLNRLINERLALAASSLPKNGRKA